MALYGILKNQTNTGLDSELLAVFAAPLSIKSNQPAFISDTLNLKRRTNSQGVQRWEIEANLVPDNDVPNFLIHSVFSGNDSEVYIRMPQAVKKATLPKNASATLSIGSNQGDSLVNITGLAENNLSMPAGEFVTFGDDPKVYLVVADLGGILQITPPLLRGTPAGYPVNFGAKVTMRCKYDTDTIKGVQYTDGILTDSGTVRLIEAL